MTAYLFGVLAFVGLLVLGVWVVLDAAGGVLR